MTMRVLITGASGFVGLNLVERLLADGATVVGLSATPIDAAVAATWRGLPGTLVDHVGDVRDGRLVGTLLATHRLDRVAHLAAITSSAERERHAADEVVSVNLAGLAAVLTAAARHGVVRFVGLGSIAVYGGQPADGSLMTEDTPHAPQNLYGLTKTAGEAITARLGNLHGLDWAIGRLGRVFGPHEHATGVRDTLSQVHQVTEHALAGRAVAFERPCRKNWNFAPDTARDLATLLAAPRLAHRIYNLGAEPAWSLADWCERLAGRVPGFRYAVGPEAVAQAAANGAAVVDLGGARDSGLLSWQRFAAEFDPPADTGLAAAFDATLDRLAAGTAIPHRAPHRTPIGAP